MRMILIYIKGICGFDRSGLSSHTPPRIYIINHIHNNDTL